MPENNGTCNVHVNWRLSQGNKHIGGNWQEVSNASSPRLLLSFSLLFRPLQKTGEIRDTHSIKNLIKSFFF